MTRAAAAFIAVVAGLLCPAAAPLTAQGQPRRLERAAPRTLDRLPTGWQTTTELDAERNAATTRVFRYGRRIGGRRAVVLQLTCLPGYQRELSIVASEYLTDYRVHNLRTTVRVRADDRDPIEVQAGLQGDYLVYLDHRSSSLVLNELDAATDTLWVGIARGAFAPYEVAFGVGDGEDGSPGRDFCTRPE